MKNNNLHNSAKLEQDFPTSEWSFMRGFMNDLMTD